MKTPVRLSFAEKTLIAEEFKNNREEYHKKCTIPQIIDKLKNKFKHSIITEGNKTKKFDIDKITEGSIEGLRLNSKIAVIPVSKKIINPSQIKLNLNIAPIRNAETIIKEIDCLIKELKTYLNPLE